MELLGELNKRDVLDFVYETYEPAEGRPRVVMQIAQEALQYPETRELTDILKLEAGRTHYPLTYPVARHMKERGPNILQVETRSLLGIMFYLSQSVKVPHVDQQRGKVTVTRDEKGNPFDWRNVTGSILEIKSQSPKPGQAAVAISYRGSWFYIDDSDLESKSTLSLLTQLLTLQAGKTEPMAPILTLPIGR